MENCALCEYCSEIDFSPLGLPMMRDLQEINSGDPMPDRHPFISPFTVFEGEHGVPYYRLGRQSRIDQSPACSMCAAIRGLLLNRPDMRSSWTSKGLEDPACLASIDGTGNLVPPEGIEWNHSEKQASVPTISRLSLTWVRVGDDDEDLTYPGRVRHSRLRSDELYEHRLIECFQTCTRGVSYRDTERNTMIFGDLAFGGRMRPALVDPVLPISWLEECQREHGTTCGVVPEGFAAPK